jgi:DNA (cytosine-5)-methyltransferase 1
LIKLLELFGGIGAPRQAFENLGVSIKSVDYVEVLQYAVKAYNNMFDHNYQVQDIRDWNMHVDLLIHGSPCQDFSKNGKNDISTGRSILYNRTLEIIDYELYPRPKVVIWENVPNLLSKRHQHHFEHYLRYMAKLGYTNKYAVLNANDYGIPQKRERLFVISILGENNFEFPKKLPMRNIKEFIDTSASFEKNQLKDNDLQLFFYENNELYLRVNSKRKYQKVREFDIINVERPTSKTRRGRIIKGVQQAPTITTSKNLAVYYDNKIRYLTALEYWRLMGFPDEKYQTLIKSGIKEEMIIFLAGNSIVVPVLEAIYKQILKLNLF